MIDFLSVENFLVAWGHVAANDGCAGVDGETIGHFAGRSEFYLGQLRRLVESGNYRPMPLRQIFIPKKDGDWRTLGVPTVRDRVVQQALLNILHPVLEPQFENVSFAYRPGRSHLMAVRQVDAWHRRGYEWVLDADVVKYFNHVRHDRLMVELGERSREPGLLGLVEQWLGTGVLTKGGIVLPEMGIPQGSPISPILANVYFDDFDEILMGTGLKLVRYADDFVILGRRQSEIVAVEGLVRELLGGMGLELHPGKTRVTNFKEGFKFLGHTFVGNVIVPGQTRGKAEAAKLNEAGRRLTKELGSGLILRYEDLPSRPTLMQGELLAAIRGRGGAIPPPMFVLLGYGVRDESVLVKIESNEFEWREGMSTLYLVKQGMALRKEQGRFWVAGEGQTGRDVEVPIREVERVLVFGNIQLSTAVIGACLEAQIPVVFLTQLGDYKGHLWSAEFCDLPVEAAQFGRRQDPAFQLAMAQRLVQGKLMNSQQFLRRFQRKRKVEGLGAKIRRIDQHLAAVETVRDLNVLRGHEGAAAVLYFWAIGQLISNPGFSFTGRSRRPPRDPFNSLLSFGYTLLFNNVMSLILAEGLNPYLGNLHRSVKKDPHLAFDLMEEWRSPVVDSLVMKLVNKRMLRPTDFTYPNAEGGVFLEEAGRRVFLKYFEERMSEEVSHPAVQQPVSYRRAIQLQVQLYKRCLLDSVPYVPFGGKDEV